MAIDLLNQAKAGDLLAIQLLLSYTIGQPRAWEECDGIDSTAEPHRPEPTVTNREAAQTHEAAPPTVSNRTVAVPTPVPAPSCGARSGPDHRPQTVLRDPFARPRELQRRNANAAEPSANGDSVRMVSRSGFFLEASGVSCPGGSRPNGYQTAFVCGERANTYPTREWARPPPGGLPAWRFSPDPR